MSGTSVFLAKKLADNLSEAVANLELMKNDDIDHEGWKMLQSEEEEVNGLEQELEELEHVGKEEAKKARREQRAEKAGRVISGHEDDDDALVSIEAMQELEEAKSQLDVDLWNFENDKFQFEVLQAQLGGKDSVSVEDKSYMIAARDLDIRFAPRGDEHRRCNWISVPETRYAVAEMLETNFFQIYGRVAPSSLFPYTKYGAYFIYNFTKDSEMDGFQFSFGEGGAGIGGEGNQILINNIYLVSKEDQAGGEDAHVYPVKRSDGWLEVELGTFFVKGGDEEGEVKLSMIEIWSGVMRKGLMVLGMELRPI